MAKDVATKYKIGLEKLATYLEKEGLTLMVKGKYPEIKGTLVIYGNELGFKIGEEVYPVRPGYEIIGIPTTTGRLKKIEQRYYNVISRVGV